jgi:hypothetical protein
MRNLISPAKAALVASAVMALAACSSETAVNNTAATEIDANAMIAEPANDASAMESAGNATEAPAAADNGADDAGADTGGDSGGNNVESNTVGM